MTMDYLPAEDCRDDVAGADAGEISMFDNDSLQEDLVWWDACDTAFNEDDVVSDDNERNSGEVGGSGGDCSIPTISCRQKLHNEGSTPNKDDDDIHSYSVVNDNDDDDVDDIISTISPSILSMHNCDYYYNCVHEEDDINNNNSNNDKSSKVYLKEGKDDAPQDSSKSATPIDVLLETFTKIQDHSTLAFIHDTDDDEEENQREKVEEAVNSALTNINERLRKIVGMANQDDVDIILAKQMNKLSIEQQLDGCKDVHGVLAQPIDDIMDFSGNTHSSASTRTTTTSFNSSNSSGECSHGNLPFSTLLEERKILELQVALTNKLLSPSDPSNNDEARKEEAYNLAMSTNSKYILDNPKFLLMFLRCENYDVPKSIQRLMHHFHVKYLLFGEQLLCEDIRYSHLTELDIEILKTGIQQFLPQRDHADRLIMVGPTTLVTAFEKGTENSKYVFNSRAHRRAIWYLSMTALQNDAISQMHGIVVVLLNIGPKTNHFFGAIYESSKAKWYNDAIPFKIGSFHCFYDKKSVGYKFISLFYFLYQKKMGSNVSRFNTHYVTTMTDMEFKLQSYGIPTTHLPVEEVVRGITGMSKQDSSQISVRLVLASHHQWVERHRAMDEIYTSASSSSPSSHRTSSVNGKDDEGKGSNSADMGKGYIVGPPKKFDVLLGRGSKCAQHTGNLRLFTIAEMNRTKYEQLSKYEKTRYTHHLVHQIKSSGGRFLKKACVGSGKTKIKFESYSWTEATDNEARDKISHVFRRLRELDAIHIKKEKKAGEEQNKKKKDSKQEDAGMFGSTGAGTTRSTPTSKRIRN